MEVTVDVKGIYQCDAEIMFEGKIPCDLMNGDEFLGAAIPDKSRSPIPNATAVQTYILYSLKPELLTISLFEGILLKTDFVPRNICHNLIIYERTNI